MDDSLSPAARLHFPLKDDPEFQLLPQYQSWSDITTAIWEHIAGDDAGDLRLIWQHSIVNQYTKRVIEQATGVGYEKFDCPYPGIEIKPTITDDYVTEPQPGQMKFEALLGTPHGVGVAWLLISRREIFPLLTVKSIRIFTTLNLFQGKIVRDYQILYTLG